MKKERAEQITQVFKNRDNYWGRIFGYHIDPQLKETTSLTYGEINPDSSEARDLISQGFKLIYPAELSPEVAEQGSRINSDFSHMYKHRMIQPLIVDSNEQPTLDFAREIVSHYLSTESISPYVGYMYGIDKKNNSISQYIDKKHFKEGSIENLTEMLNDFGFSASLDELGNLNIHSDIPYPTVPKSKFQTMFDKAKGRIRNTFDKLKSFTKPKENEKDTQGPEL